ASGPRSGRQRPSPATCGTSTSTGTATWTAGTTASSTGASAGLDDVGKADGLKPSGKGKKPQQSGRWGPYRQASPPPARHRPGARSARRPHAHRGTGSVYRVDSTRGAISVSHPGQPSPMAKESPIAGPKLTSEDRVTLAVLRHSGSP